MGDRTRMEQAAWEHFAAAHPHEAAALDWPRFVVYAKKRIPNIRDSDLRDLLRLPQPSDCWRPIYWADQHLGDLVCIGQIHEETGAISPPWHFAPAKGGDVIPDDVRAKANLEEPESGMYLDWSAMTQQRDKALKVASEYYEPQLRALQARVKMLKKRLLYSSRLLHAATCAKTLRRTGEERFGDCSNPFCRDTRTLLGPAERKERQHDHATRP